MRIDRAAVKLAVSKLQLQYTQLAEDEESWALAIESETDVDECLKQIVEKIDDTMALAGGTATRIAELQLRLARFEQREKALRKLAMTVMDAASIRKKELALATLSISKGRERVEILDEASVPDIFCNIKTVRTPDKDRIKAELLQPGKVAQNWAALVTGDPSLSIRTK